MWKTLWTAAAILIVAALAWLLTARAAQTRPAGGVDELWFAIRVGPSLVEWFNETARPDDIAIVSAEALDLLDQITVGRKQLMFSSVAAAEAIVPTWADKVDIIGYDLEQWPTTPAEEQADPVAAVQRLHRLAQTYGLTPALRTDRRFAAGYSAELAPYIDVFTLQVQRLQGDPATLRDFTVPLIQTLRQAKPDLDISVQLRSEGSVDQLVALTHSLQALQDGIDGVSILYSPYSPATVELAQAFVSQLRSDKLDISVLPTSAEGQTLATLAPTTGAEATPAATAAPLPTATSPPTQCTWPTGLVLTGSGLVAARARRRRKRARR
jgi:hypothetical protein